MLQAALDDAVFGVLSLGLLRRALLFGATHLARPHVTPLALLCVALSLMAPHARAEGHA